MRSDAPGKDDAGPPPAPPAEPTLRLGLGRCPRCQAEVDPADAGALVCAACLARHHGACWSGGGRCGACGGAEPLAAPTAPPGPGALGSRALGLAFALVLALVAALVLVFPAGSPPEETASRPAPPTGAPLEPPPPLPVPTPPRAPARAEPPRSIAGLAAEVEGRDGRAVIRRVWLGGAAERAGLDWGHAIFAVDAVDVDGPSALEALLASRVPGEEVVLEVGDTHAYGWGQPGQDVRTVRVRLAGLQPRSEPPAASPLPSAEAARQRLLDWLGLDLADGAAPTWRATQRGSEPPGPERCAHLAQPPAPGSAAAAAGLEVESRLLALERQPVESAVELLALLERCEVGARLELAHARKSGGRSWKVEVVALVLPPRPEPGAPPVDRDAAAARGWIEHARARAPATPGTIDVGVGAYLDELKLLGDGALPILIEALGSDHGGVRRLAAGALVARCARAPAPSAEVRAALVQASQDHPDASIRSRLARALGDVAAHGAEARPTSLEALAARLRDPDAGVRREAAQALGRLGPIASPTAPTLCAALGRGRDGQAAADALAAIGEAAVPHLVEALGRGDVYARHQAARALGEIGAPALEAVRAALDDPALQLFALHALRAMGATAKPALPAVSALAAEASDPQVRLVAGQLAKVLAR